MVSLPQAQNREIDDKMRTESSETQLLSDPVLQLKSRSCTVCLSYQGQAAYDRPKTGTQDLTY